MKIQIIILASILNGLMLMQSCKKTEVTSLPLASVNITNAIVNVPEIKVKYQGNNTPIYFTAIQGIAYGSFANAGVNAERNIPFAIAASADTTKSVFGSNFNLKRGSMYSIFLTGQLGAIDTMMIEEFYPSFKDSTFSVRFINLSPNSQPISINLLGNSIGTESSSLSFKKRSLFINHSATASNSTYTFEIRATDTGNILATYVFKPTAPANPIPRFKSCTLAWIGDSGQSGTYGNKIIRINHY